MINGLRAGSVALALAAAAPLAAWQTTPDGVQVSMVRFYRGERTLVDGFCRVPYQMLEPIGSGVAHAAYRVELTVRDGAGTVLHSSSWSQTVPEAVVRVPHASTVEHFTFAAPAGSYTVEVAVTDSSTGRTARERTDVRAFEAKPRVSDLLVSSAMRRAAPSDTAPGSGEIRKGTMLIASTTHPVLTPRDARLFYYVELYPQAGGSVETTARVMAPDGRVVITAQPLKTDVGADGGVAATGLDLTGLPPGEYRMALDVRFADTTVTREAAFAMAGFDTEAAVASAGGTVAGDWATRLNEVQLDTVYRPLVHIMEGGERGIYDGLSLQGKRNYLRAFWAKRDPTPGTQDNEAQAEFYGRIDEANRRFREGGTAEVPGWRTDRGRIFIRYGEPDEVLRRPQSGSTPPYEVWKYTQTRPRKFLFLDQTRFGNYALIYTDERREPSRPDWEQTLGPEAVMDIKRF